jgi:hypothetical protein
MNAGCTYSAFHIPALAAERHVSFSLLTPAPPHLKLDENQQNINTFSSGDSQNLFENNPQHVNSIFFNNNNFNNNSSMKTMNRVVMNKLSIAVLTAVLLVCAPACKDDDDNDAPVDKVVAMADFDIDEDGNWVGYKVFSSPYVNNGFALQLPETVPAEHLFLMSDRPGGEKITATPATVKILLIEMFVGYKKDKEVGEFFYAKVLSENQNVSAVYMYAENDVTIHGTKTETYSNWTEFESWNVSLTQGWNIVYCVYTEDETTGTDSWEYSNNNPGGLQWIYDEYRNPEPLSARASK